MMDRKALTIALLLVGALCAAPSAWADEISLSNGTQTVTVTNGYSTLDTDSDSYGGNIASWSQVTSASDTDRAGYASTGSVDTELAQSGFDLDFTLSASRYRSNGQRGSAGAFGSFYFQALDDLTYDLSGSLTTTSGSGNLYLRTFLRDATAATYLFDTSGSLTGGSSVSLSGTGLTGSLQKNHAYQLYFQYYAQTTDYNGKIGATGALDLTFGSTSTTTSGPQPVPEPGTLTLLGLGVVGLGAARRRSRARSA